MKAGKNTYIFLIIIFFIIIYTYPGYSKDQYRVPKGGFIEHSLKIGQPVHYSLKIKHAPSAQILFPDSTYDYGSFEYINKKYFPTYTKNGLSTDSVVYTLTTFELEETLALKIPVYIISENDTLKIFPEKDNIQVKKVYQKNRNKKDKLKANTYYQKINKKINYPLILWITIGLVLLILIVLLIFGKSLLNRWKSYRMKKAYRKFLRQFVTEEAKLYENPNAKIAESALHIWKSYLQRLLKQPVTSWSSKEVVNYIPDDNLKQSLQQIDKAIYGGKTEEEIKYAITYLKKIAKKQYEKKQKEVING